MSQALIVFCKAPVLNEVKTRLAHSVGPKTALYFYQKLLEHTLTVTHSANWTRIISYNKPFHHTRFTDNDSFIVQKGIDLGAKMEHTLSEAFKQKHQKVIIVGSDIPELTNEVICEAFNALNAHDVVLGPTKDGGYYLLGLKRIFTEFFASTIPWSTPKVFEKTTQICLENNLSYFTLQQLSDIDNQTDLQQHKNFFK